MLRTVVVFTNISTCKLNMYITYQTYYIGEYNIADRYYAVSLIINKGYFILSTNPTISKQ